MIKRTNALNDKNEEKIVLVFQKYIDEIKVIQAKLLDILDFNNTDEENNLFSLFYYLETNNITENKPELKSFLHLLIQISNYYHRVPDFFTKFETIIIKYQKQITKYFTNYEIFNIFKSNKRILLYLFQNKIIIIDQPILNIILSKKYKDRKYPEYFIKEIKSFCNYNTINNNCIDIKEFDTKRKIAENDNIICTYIINDSVKEFISYVNRTNYSLQSTISPSIFESHIFLMDKEPSLIEYAAFYGSIQIIRYLIFNKVQMTPSLWMYAIHGKNPEVIHLLEENNIIPDNELYFKLYLESLKCHHNDFAFYIKNNFLELTKEDEIVLFKKQLKLYNFIDFTANIVKDIDCNEYIPCLCKYDYITLFKNICNICTFDPNLSINKKSYLIEKNETLISIATKKGNKEIVQILLARFNIDINKKCIINRKTITQDENHSNLYDKYDNVTETIEQKTPIIIAVEKGNFKIVQLLLSNLNIDINFEANYQIKKYLMKYGNKYDQTNKNEEYKTALIIAFENNLPDICKLLCSSPKINLNSKLIKINYCLRGYFNMSSSDEVQKIYKSTEEKALLIMAIEKGYSNFVQYLLSKNQINPNSKYIKTVDFDFIETDIEEKTALMMAIEKEDLKIVRLLLSHKDINVNEIYFNKTMYKKHIIEKNALIFAIERENFEITKLLLSHKNIDVNAKFKEFSQIAKYSATVTFYDKVGIHKEKTALYIAVEKNNENIVQLLLLNPKINVNSKLLLINENITAISENIKYKITQKENKTAFILAIEKGIPQIVQYFLKRDDIDLNYISVIESDIKKYTLYERANMKCEKYEKYEKKIEQKSALYIAVEKNFTDIVHLLLNQKIDINFKYVCKKQQTYIQVDKMKSKKEEKTALHVAVENSNNDIVKLLLSKNEIDVNSKFIKCSDLYKKPKIQTPLSLAIQNKNLDIIKLFLNNKKTIVPKELQIAT